MSNHKVIVRDLAGIETQIEWFDFVTDAFAFFHKQAVSIRAYQAEIWSDFGDGFIRLAVFNVKGVN